MQDSPSIEERENGPLVVKHVRTMTGPDGAPVEVKEIMALCRCGASKTKPFCDGSHTEVGFQSRGGDPSGTDRVITYTGTETVIAYNPRVCAHAAFCVRDTPEVFDPDRKPWCDPDQGTYAEIEAVVRNCPSGALQIAAPGDAPVQIVDEDRPDVMIERNGPYWVTDIEPPVLNEAAGTTPRKYVLCRCGLSGMKPFCDGSHANKGWSDES